MSRKSTPPPRDLASRIGLPFLRALRSVPIVRERVIPWFVREELDQIPAAPMVAAMRRELERVAKSRGPILAGPWLSEVGFELLYWIPFLQWATAEFGIDRRRLTAVSRGGAASWYQHVSDGYVDLFDLFTVEEYRQRNEERWAQGGNQKQYEIGPFDREIASRVVARTGMKAPAMLHPATMYRLLRFFWYKKAPVSLWKKHTRYEPLAPPALPPDRYGLPAGYVAVRFYFRPSFPDTAENRAFAADLVARIARDRAVVLLNPGLSLDDHADHDPGAGSNIYRIDDRLAPADNLQVQSAVIAGADAFVGTYGGLSYLGPYYRVPTIAFYSHAPELVPAHLDITWRLCQQMGSPLAMVSVAEAARLGDVIGQAGLAASPEVAAR